MNKENIKCAFCGCTTGYTLSYHPKDKQVNDIYCTDACRYNSIVFKKTESNLLMREKVDNLTDKTTK